MTANPQPPPEAALIRARRKAAVPRLSMSGAAKRAARDGLGGFSAALWTKIENGYDQVARGVVLPYSGTAEKVARMARVVGVTAAELGSCGRPDAAAGLTGLPPAQISTMDDLVARLEYVEARLEEALTRRGGSNGDDEEDEHHENNGSRRAV